MGPAAVAAIGAAGSIIGGITGGKGAKAAAKTQAKTAQAQIAALERNQQYITGLSQPTLDRGNAAGATYAGLLGLGDASASKQALDTWRGSTGYQDVLDTGLKAVNANAYARGFGDSGATLKALQAKGMSLADQNQGVYMSNLNNLIQTGNSAIGNIAGVATQTTAGINGANQGAADASSNASLISGSAWQQALRNLTNVGMGYAQGNTMGSSYSGFAPGFTAAGVSNLNPAAQALIQQNPGIF